MTVNGYHCYDKLRFALFLLGLASTITSFAVAVLADYVLGILIGLAAWIPAFAYGWRHPALVYPQADTEQPDNH